MPKVDNHALFAMLFLGMVFVCTLCGHCHKLIILLKQGGAAVHNSEAGDSNLIRTRPSLAETFIGDWSGNVSIQK